MQNMEYIIEIPTNLKNFVESFKINESQHLFPLYELVVNSIQSIHQRKHGKGEVHILVHRETPTQINLDESVNKQTDVCGFTVSDDGVGFNSQNLASFKTAFSGYKIELGCKGVGRFLALASCERMEVESIYEEDEKFHQKKFDFKIKGFVNEKSHEVIQPTNLKTTISLINYKKHLRKAISPNTISTNLLHHCLIYFITKSNPKIIIYDDALEEPIDLEDQFESFFQIEDNQEFFNLSENQFEVNFIKNYSKQSGSHKIHYCGDRREVQTENLNNYIPVLKDKKISDQDGAFYISAYVKGDYLNKHINPSRNELTIPKTRAEKDLLYKVSMDEVGSNVAIKVREQFDEIISKLSDEHRSSYKDFIFKNAPEYKYLTSDDEALDHLKPASTPSEKISELQRVSYEMEVKQKQRLDAFLSNGLTNIKDSADYKERINLILQEENKLGQSKLTSYMIHRKAILKLLEKFIELQADGEFKYESDIHDIIFVRNKENNQIKFNEHNLWILDERLAYSKHLASDKKFNETSFVDSSSEKKPDLLIYDYPFAYGDEDTCVVIFEFKRPMRDYFSKEEKNLGIQVKNYAKDLISGKVKAHNGRFTKIDKNTPKFGYIICDYPKDVEIELELEGYKKTPKRTLFKYEEGLNMYVEIMDYNQLLEDANLRHKAFFKELGILHF